MAEKNNKEEKRYLRTIKGSIISIAFSLVSLILFSLLLTYTNVPERIIPVLIIIISVISVLIGSIYSTNKINSKGLLNGSLIGLIYIFSIYLLSSILVCGFNINIKTIIMTCMCIISGMIGGIIGINLKK